MLMSMKCKLMGAESRPGFKNPQELMYVIGLAQGVSTLRLYVTAAQFAQCLQIEPYSDVEAELEFKPDAQKVSYCMSLVNITPM